MANNQYGFRKKYSTSLALLHLHDKITSAVDERKYTAGLFLDLSKAFDTVNHDILLGKFEHYGIRGLALEWVKSYLCNRLQYVEFNGISSSYKEILCGVVHGPLGPVCMVSGTRDNPPRELPLARYFSIHLLKKFYQPFS